MMATEVNSIPHFRLATLNIRGLASEADLSIDEKYKLDFGKGQVLIDNVKNYLRGRATDYFAILPYIQRMFNDFDPLDGTYYKPPSADELTVDVPEELRELYKAQSAVLYAEIQRKAETNIMDDIKGDFAYGMHDQLGPIHCTENDGLMAVFCLITKYRPQDAEFRDSVEQCFIEAHRHFAFGDPRTKITYLQEKLNEAVKLKIPMKWSSTGKTIAQVVARRDPDLADVVRKYKIIAPPPEQSAHELNRMFAAIKLACNDIDKGSLGKSNKNWNVKAHNATIRIQNKKFQDRPTSGIKSRLGKRDNDPSKIPCRHGDKCGFHASGNCKFQHKKSGSKRCMAKGCHEDSPQGKKLCKKHFDQAVEKGKVPLKDGSDFTWMQTRRNQDDKEKNKFQFSPAKVALAAMQVIK